MQGVGVEYGRNVTKEWSHFLSLSHSHNGSVNYVVILVRIRGHEESGTTTLQDICTRGTVGGLAFHAKMAIGRSLLVTSPSPLTSDTPTSVFWQHLQVDATPRFLRFLAIAPHCTITPVGQHLEHEFEGTLPQLTAPQKPSVPRMRLCPSPSAPLMTFQVASVHP